MPTHRAPVRRPPRRRTGRQWLTGLGSLLVLVLLLAGLPAALWSLAGNPLPAQPSQLPNLDELQQYLVLRYDDLLLRAIAVVGWLGWISFAIPAIVELFCQLLRIRPPRLFGMRWQQRRVAALIAAILAAGVGPAVASANAAAYSAAPPEPASPPPASDHIEPRASEPADSYVEHTVGPGEALLDVAERYGVPWQRIVEATHRVEQPDGQRLTPGQTRVREGWTLRVPVTHTAAATQTPTPLQLADTTAPADRPVYEVARGDWLGGIAERFLGDFNRYPDLADLNPELEDRDPRFPDHIEATWHIRLPADAHDRGPRPHATGSLIAGTTEQPPTTPTEPEHPTPPEEESPPAPPPTPPAVEDVDPPGHAPGDEPPTESPSPTPGAAELPGSAPTGPPGTTPSAGTSTPTPGPSPSAAAAPYGDSGDTTADDDTSQGTLIPIAFGAALIAATLGVTTAVKLRRRGAAGDPRVDRTGHRHGHRPQRVDKGAVEQRLHVAAQPLDVDRLDGALRLLAAELGRRHGSRLPDIIGVHVEQGDIHLLLTEAADAQPEPPWQADHIQWTLAAGEDVPPVADGTLAALPTLVTVGSQVSHTGAKAGEYLLLDLERLGCLGITGDAGAAQDLLRYLASELAMNTWCDDVEIICAGWSPREAELLIALNPDRVRVADGPILDQVEQLRQRVRIAFGTLANVGAVDALAGRVHDLAGDSWMPTVLLAADPRPADLEAIVDLAGDLARVGRCAIAVVTIGDIPTRGDQPEAVHTLTVTPDRAVHVPFLDATMAAAGLPLHELEPLARVISNARDGVEEPVPSASEPEPWAAGTDAAGALLPAVHPRTGIDEGTDGDDRPGLLEVLGFLDSDGSRPPPAADGESITDALEDEPLPVVETVTRDLPEPAALPLEAAAATQPERAEVDPELDAELAAWYQPVADRPHIRVLGPVVDAKEVIDAPGQPPKPGRLLLLAEVLVYLAQCGRRGANPTRLDEDLWGHEVQVTYRRATISRARQWAGRRPDGTPWLAEVHYRLEDGYLLDWHLFRRLRARSQSLGPDGAADLRAALKLVRGVPLAGFERIAATTRSPYNWLPTSDIDPDHLVAAIVDTAHELAQLCLATGDTAGARWAVDRAWLVDPDRHYDQPWQDILHIHAADGHHAELEATVNELMRIREAEVEEDLDPATYALLRELLPAGYWDSGRQREPAAH